MNYKGQKVLVVGLGKSGISAAKFLIKIGAKVTVTDVKRREELLEDILKIESIGGVAEVGGHRLESFLDSEIIVVSPAVPLNIEPLNKASKKGIEIISEIELAFRFIKIPIIAITGTNGKSTVTTLVGEILKNQGKRVFVCGNIGIPITDCLDKGDTVDYIVAEISSFQLEGIKKFKPYLSILLNITEDHLDRYTSYNDYIEAKMRIFENQKRSQYAVLNADDPIILKNKKRVKARVYLFSISHEPRIGCFLKDGKVVYRDGIGEDEFYNTNNIKIKGIHNLENIMAAIVTAKLCGSTKDVIENTINEFPGLPHRMEWVRELRGVNYYNDSKGTNVGAVVKSLESFKEKIILIAGGKDKGGSYEPLKELVKNRVKALVLIGEAKERIAKTLTETTEIVMADSLKEAVEISREKAVAGDVVLLSPACSSFDMFSSYEERGMVFKKTVESFN